MPAVTVEDLTTVPSLPEVGEDARIRPVRSVTTAPAGFEGEGFPVRRAFAGVNLAIWYGFALIVVAFVLALIYGWACRKSGDEPEDRP